MSAHGTYPGVVGCRCDDCRECRRDYTREYRRRNPDKLAKDAERQRLRNRALRVLAHRHSAELERIIRELRAAS